MNFFRRKKNAPQRRIAGSLALVALMVGAARGRAQYVEWGGPPPLSPWTDFTPRLRYVRTDLELERDSYTSPGAPQLQVDRIYWTTGFGLAWNNYIYHPYLLTYAVLFEPGFELQESGPPGRMNQSDLWLLDGSVTANLLEVKPYATSVTYIRSHTETKNNFFNSATVDTQGWGVNSGYSAGAVPFTLGVSQSHEDSTSLNQDSTTDQTLFNLHAWNERFNENKSDLTYQYGDFKQGTDISGAAYNSENSYNHAALTDVEYFRKSTLHSSLLFNDIEAQNSGSSQQANGMLNWNIQHTPQLQSYYDYSFSRNTTTSSDSTQNAGTAGLTHQLYDSLTSSLSVNGSKLNSHSDGSTSDADQAGVNVSENYVKRLGDWGGLNLADNASYTYNDQQTGGSQQVISGESHTVPNSRVVLLNQPNDLAITSVTDATGTKLLVPGADYTVNQTVNPWQIQIALINSANIQPGDGILVTYTADANPSGNYEVLANQSQITFTFWHGHADVFARYNFTDDQASSPEFFFQNQQEFQVGGDVSWRKISVHGDFTDSRSSLYNSRQYSLAENYAVFSTDRSTLSASMNQQWGTYNYNAATNSQVQSATFYNFMVHYDVRLQSHLTWNSEAGYLQQHGLGQDQKYLAARTYLNWVRGKLEVHLGYEHETQDFDNQSSLRDYVFVRIKRDF